MPKRKLSDLETTTTSANPTKPTLSAKQHLQASRLSNKFDHDVQALSKALKVARGFEKQKMGRRGKKAKTEEESKAIARLEEEGKLLKTLNMDAVATKYLFKQLSKTKRIAESAPFTQFKESKRRISTDGPQTSAEANVLARLYKSNPVKNVFPGIMEGFRRILSLDESVAVPAGGKREPRTKSGQDEKESKKARDTKQQDEDADSEDQDMDRENANSDDDDDFAQFDASLAASSSSEDEDDHNDAMSITPSASPSPSPEAESQSQPQPTKKPKQAQPTPATSTTFLPSLAMGGYVSGSESEDPDAENVQPQRKNRMGQQARRALWEKKYGAGAKHVREQQEREKKDRDRGWDVRRGATGSSLGGRGRKMDGSRPQRDNGGPEQTQAKKEDDKPIHPSWEAARKAKEAKTTMAFQGSKVTFD